MSSNKSKMTPRPPKPADVDAFINAANDYPEQNPAPEKAKEEKKDAKAEKSKSKKETYPWEMPGIREDVAKHVNLSLSEPYREKLKYVCKETRISQQQFIRDCLYPAIDREIKKIMKQDPQE